MKCLIFVFVLLVSSCLSQQNVSHVHIVFSCHLDIGYNGISPVVGFIHNVVNKYFDVYFPLALETATSFRKMYPNPDGDRYTFMTHSWLVSMYLDCPPSLGFHCPNETSKSSFIAGLKRGDITYHAYPFNAELEAYANAESLEMGLLLTQHYDTVLGVQHKSVVSQRDVPGMTRASLPSWSKHGVKGVSIGVNGASAPPNVPQIFRWVDAVTNTSIIGMVNAGGYGGIARHPQLNHVLAMEWKTDNTGPHTVQEAMQVYQLLRSQFNGAKVFASTFDAFVDVVETLEQKGKVQLERVTAEMGDTWIYGYASDPLKMAQYRAFSSVLSPCIQSGHCDFKNDWRIVNASRFLMKPIEHTWGLPNVNGVFFMSCYDNVCFDKFRNMTAFANCSQSYLEQRLYIDHALSALEDHPIATSVVKALKQVESREPNLAGLTPVDTLNFTNVFTCDNATIQFDFLTGAITNFATGPTRNVTWAVEGTALLAFTYSTYDLQSFSWFHDNYRYYPCGPFDFECDNSFVKDNLNASKPVRGNWFPSMKKLWWSQSQCRFVQQLTFQSYPTNSYGAPQLLWVDLQYQNGSMAVDINAMNKRSTRMPEALYVAFNSVQAQQEPFLWSFTKLDQPVSPLHVMLNGSQAQHAVSQENSVQQQGVFSVSSLDAVLATTVQTPFPKLDLLNDDDLEGGISFILHSNAWNTNFPLYYPYDSNVTNMRFRFRIDFYQ